MTYLNPVFTYGKEKFISRCAECGLDGLIVPDMPFEEKDELVQLCERYRIDLISMIAPSSDDRVSLIAKEAKGFIYCVSSLGVTGVRGEISTDIGQIVQKIREVSDVPCAIGFGISTPEQAGQMAQLSDGVIVGSAIVKLVAKHGKDCVQFIADYIHSMKKGIAEFND